MRIDSTTTYTGWKTWTPTNDEWSDFFMEKKVPFEMLENEYLIIYDSNNQPTFYCYEQGRLRPFRGGSIKVSKDKTTDDQVPQTGIKKGKPKFAKDKDIVITPRNAEQHCAFDLIKDQRKTVKLLTGTWGAGKDLIMTSFAIEALNKGLYEKIIWVRNDTDLKDTKPMGALPGDVTEKFLPFLGPFIDHVGKRTVELMLKQDQLVIEPLQSLRGRNFKNSIILCSEAENMTYDQLKLLIARVADGSCLLINGDVRQRDKAIFEKSKGLEKFITCLKGEPLFGYVHLPRSERSATASLADKLDTFEFSEE